MNSPVRWFLLSSLGRTAGQVVFVVQCRALRHRVICSRIISIIILATRSGGREGDPNAFYNHVAQRQLVECYTVTNNKVPVDATMED